ncbi:glutamate-cysteine ligase family protein [Halobacterium bonnevillei]|uniref:Glutamate--cysteine ligase n=1 Tax=Halobacterium bonnevillei TaxID=2692200 RepID=A0A6B0SGE2_9EURY|nr:glutamate-cysteine ligase family protein [Halobacterium bonnevillei]MXR20805.1 glutamate--cysteine ligase [Halobacterium bonnevillei]
MTVTTGIELELWVVDQNGRLTDGRAVADAHCRIEPEFVTSMLEVKTAPRDSLPALRRDFHEILQTAIRAAHAGEKRLVPLGTPLTASDGETHTERGELFEAIYGDGVECAKNCAGAHVHFERDETVRQLRTLTALDPALALVSSAPYYCGTGVQSSARAHAYRLKCGEEFQQFCDLWPYADCVADWRDRVDERFAAFTSLATDRGVSSAVVADHFTPENTVLNPVRLRECQPTVEWRAPDSALPSQLLQLTADVEAVVAQTASKPVVVGSPGLHDNRVGIPEFETLRGLSKAAINFGLQPRPVRSYLEAFGFDCSAYQPLSPRIADGDSVTEADARSLCLAQADRLEADVDDGLAPPSTRDGLFEGA